MTYVALITAQPPDVRAQRPTEGQLNEIARLSSLLGVEPPEKPKTEYVAFAVRVGLVNRLAVTRGLSMDQAAEL